MTTRRDEAKLREVADHHAADDPALAAQLYADADYLAQLRKASTNLNRDNTADDEDLVDGTADNGPRPAPTRS